MTDCGLIHPVAVTGGIVVTVAAVGVAVNVVATGVLARANRASINVRGAFAHIVTDLYAFIGTLAAGIVIIVSEPAAPCFSTGATRAASARSPAGGPSPAVVTAAAIGRGRIRPSAVSSQTVQDVAVALLDLAVADSAGERELGLDEAGVDGRHRRCQRAGRSGRAASLRHRSF